MAPLVKLDLSTKLVKLNVVLHEAKYWEKRFKKWVRFFLFHEIYVINLIAITHKIVNSDERFIDDYPIRILGPFNQQIGHGWDRDIWFVRAMK
jgi:hypothetical protein